MDLKRLRDSPMEEKTSELSPPPTAAYAILMRNHTRPPAADSQHEALLGLGMFDHFRTNTVLIGAVRATHT
jgi:hypothetical protein